MKKRMLVATVLMALLTGHAAWAQTEQAKAGGVSRDLEKQFTTLDRNGDGFISREELSGNEAFTKAFEAADKDHDGKLDRAEFQALEAEGSPDRSLGSVSPQEAGAGSTSSEPKR